MKHVFTCRVPIRWGDMDAQGHVNNTVFFRYIEEVRVAWFEGISGGVPGMGAQGPAVIHTSMTFLRQLKYPGEVELRLQAGNPGRSSFETTVEMRRTDAPDVLVAEGSAKIVWCDYDTEKSVPLPDVLRAQIA